MFVLQSLMNICAMLTNSQIMRLDFVQRQKQWEAQLAREAPLMPSDPPEDEEEGEEYDLPSSSNAMQVSAPSTQQPTLDYEVDEVEQREREELEALLSYMPADEHYERDEQSEHLYSDDDDYDALFSEIIAQDAGWDDQTQQQPAEQDDGEEMDTS